MSPVATRGKRREGGSRGKEVMAMEKQKPPASGSQANSESTPKQRIRIVRIFNNLNGPWEWDDQRKVWRCCRIIEA